MCPCKKELIPPPDNLWFFLLLGFGIIVALVFLICELLKRHQKLSAFGIGAAYPETVSKKVNPEFSDFLVQPAAAAVVTTAAFQVAAAPSATTKKSEAASSDASAAVAGKTPPVYTISLSNSAKKDSSALAAASTPTAFTIPLSNATKEPMTRKVKLRSAFLANSSSEESMRTLDVRELPSATQRSSLKPSAAPPEPSSDSEEEEDIAPVGTRNIDDEDDDEPEPAQKSEPKPKPQTRRILKELPDPVKGSQPQMQTSIQSVQAISSTESNQSKIKLRSLPVKSSFAASEYNKSVQLVQNTETQHTQNRQLQHAKLNEAETQTEGQLATTGIESDVQFKLNDLPASATKRSSAPKHTRNLVQSLENQHEGTTRKLDAITTNGVASPILVQSELLQSSQTESRTMTSTTETTNIRESNLNTASLSRLRKREYELAALLRQLRTVESKVEHLSTELEKKDFLAHYKLSREDLFQTQSPLLRYTDTNNEFHSNTNLIQRNYNNVSNYSTITRSLVDLNSSADRSHDTLVQNSRRYVEPVNRQYGTPEITTETRSIRGLPQGNNGNHPQNGHQIPYRSASTEQVQMSESNGQSRNSNVSPIGFRFHQQDSSPVSPTLYEQSAQRKVQYNLRFKDQASPGSDGQYGDRYTASRNSFEGLESNSELKLSEAIRQLRADCELKLVQNRDEQEAASVKRESELYGQILKLANAFQFQTTEFNNLQSKLSSLEESLSGLNGQKLMAETRLMGMDLGNLEEQGNSSVEEISRLKGLILKMLKEKQELLSDFQHLQEAKTSLDTEIATYRALLDHEELRLDQIFQHSESLETSVVGESKPNANGGSSRNLLSISKNFQESEI